MSNGDSSQITTYFPNKPYIFVKTSLSNGMCIQNQIPNKYTFKHFLDNCKSR